ncbi:UNC93-like protein MFSD11 isoform X2 [Paramacrobiotus metropolitanus]|uniref:UNC93-like protein MFSD11 isoform X2 n=1 Tax=Paramacrobiotus metropolitanus TaxID=2943436 RepID=UPI002445B469|nr:UNC93-like protein MFSD11 isoform X2 [Paramacrobiotus metropolitanus]
MTVVLNSVHDNWFDGSPTEGYVFMAINCATQAVAYLFGASVSALIGPKLVLVAGSVCISLYIASFIRPFVATIYAGSVIAGMGGGFIWAVQGYFVAVNSRSDTVERNYGIFWGIFQSSLISGSLFYFFMLRGADTITPNTRYAVFATLTTAAVVGVILFSLIRHPWTSSTNVRRPAVSITRTRTEKAKEELIATVKLGLKREMLFLVPHFFYIGMQATFWNSVYSTTLGYTLRFGNIGQSLVGLNGVFLGIGEIIASSFLGLAGKWSNRHGRDIFLIAGMITHFVALYLIFLNLPSDAPIHPTSNGSYLGNPNAYLAMFCIAIFGVGDAIWTNQLMAYLGWVYPYKTVAAFGVYQFYCAVVNSAAFWYSTILTLPYQFLLLVGTALPAAAGFCWMEWKTSRRTWEANESLFN